MQIDLLYALARNGFGSICRIRLRAIRSLLTLVLRLGILGTLSGGENTHENSGGVVAPSNENTYAGAFGLENGNMKEQTMATRKKFKCSRCDRTFAMAAHLARHKNASHGSRKVKAAGRKGKAVSAKRREPKPRAVRNKFPAASPARSDGSGGVLRAMASFITELSAQRNAIDAQITGMQNAMSMLNGAGKTFSGGARRGRPPGSGGRANSLKPVILRVLRQRSTPLSPREIATAVVKVGYQTKSTNLTKAVSNVLPQMTGVRKVGRGQYRA